MKCGESFLYVLSITIALFLFGCGTMGNGTSGSAEPTYNSNKVIVDNPSIDLTDYLRRISGINVAGSGPNATVTIRGINTLLGDPSPLYVVDGIRMGRNFNRVYSFINVNDISSIEVLKGADASIYGVEGGGGVIIFNSKN